MNLPLKLAWALLLAVAVALSAAEEPPIDLKLAPGELQVVPSFEACSYYFRPNQGTAPFRTEFRRTGEPTWMPAFDPVSDQPTGVWKGSVFDLPEDTDWELRVTDKTGTVAAGPATFRTWTSRPKIAKLVDLSTVPGAANGLVLTDQGTPDGWIKYTAPRGWKIERGSDLADTQRGAVTLRRARYVILENLTIVGGAYHGIQLEECDSVRILNCDISGWGRVGKQQYTNDGSRGKYADVKGELINYDAGVKIDRSARTVVERCYVHDPRGRSNSWQYSHPAGPTAVHVNNTLGGTVLRWNDFVGSDEHRWNDVIESSNNGAANGGFYRDSDISGNFLAFGNDDGVELEGGGMNVRFYRNKIEGTTCAISTGACLLGPQFVYGNLVTNPGDETGLALMFFKNSHGVAQGGKRHFVGNTLYGVSVAPYGSYGKPLGNERIGYMRNNVFYSSSSRVPGETSRRDDFDGDLFWTDESPESSRAYLAALQKIGQEAHGVAANPAFTAAERGDFHLSSASPGRGKSLPVANLAEAARDLGAFASPGAEVPFRPLALVVVPAQLNFGSSDAAAQEIRLTVPATADAPVPFEVRQNRVFSWFQVSPTRGIVEPGKAVTLRVSVNPNALQGRPLFRGAFLVRTPEGLSRPVTVYAKTDFTVDLRPSGARHSTYLEAAELPEAKTLVRTTTAAGVFGGRYVALPASGASPELHGAFDVSQPGHYVLLVRAAIERGAMSHREFGISIDGGAVEKVDITPDYEWNTNADHFRAVYLRALGELKSGRHDVRLTVKGGLKLNEIIITDRPAAFFADGWQAEGGWRAE